MRTFNATGQQAKEAAVRHTPGGERAGHATAGRRRDAAAGGREGHAAKKEA